LHLSGHLRDLPSFPTRRSSDLAWAAPVSLDTFPGRNRPSGCGSGSSTGTTPSGASKPDRSTLRTFSGAFSAPTVLASTSGEPMRSEEHTSELQSRSDLVCRLLL